MAIADVVTPSKVVLAADYVLNYAYSIADGYGVYPEYMGPHEPGTTWGNAVFVDGHVSWIRLAIPPPTTTRARAGQWSRSS